MRLVLMGPPGAGKGTQAKRLTDKLGVPHVSTGEILRGNVAAGTEIGQRAQAFMERGEYVPDDLVNAMVADRLTQPDAAAGFLLDGYPRTAAQVTELNKMLQRDHRLLDWAVEIVADHEEIVARLLRRAELEGRADDTEDVIRNRLAVYTAETEPLARLYGEQGILVRVDGMGSVGDVTERILAAIAA